MTFHPKSWFDMQLDNAKSIADNRGGSCLSKKFVNGREHMKWMCSCGHIWFSNYNNIKYGRWCPVCGFERMLDTKRYSLNDCKRTALERRGVCLAKEYKSNKIPIHWMCKFGHEWYACYHNVLINNTWCPHCKVISIGEKITRKFFEIGFGEKFFRCRPEWLINKKGNRLELDGYSKKLKIAFEYNGEQHSKESPWFHTHKRFIECISSDKIKKNLCRKHGVVFIIIDHNISFENIAKFIYDTCVKSGLSIDKKILSIDYKRFDLYVRDLDIERDIVESNGGKLLSDKYISYDSPLDIMCSNGHNITMSSDRLKRGQWKTHGVLCKFCRRKNLKGESRSY